MCHVDPQSHRVCSATGIHLHAGRGYPVGMAETPPNSPKETTFEFDLIVSDEESLSGLLREFQAVAGVKQVDMERDPPSATLKIRVVFPDKTVAMRLHRSAMKTIMKTPGVSISRVTTKLTEIFD